MSEFPHMKACYNKLGCTYGQFGSTLWPVSWERTSPMQSKINFLILRFLNFTIRFIWSCRWTFPRIKICLFNTNQTSYARAGQKSSRIYYDVPVEPHYLGDATLASDENQNLETKKSFIGMNLFNTRLHIWSKTYMWHTIWIVWPHNGDNAKVPR